MKLFRAIYAFYHQLVHQDCDHLRVFPKGYASQGQACHCPDCGYPIKLLWALIRCRECGTRRVPKRQLNGDVVPMHPYCSQCGATQYRITKKESIEAYEMVYALSLKEIDYSEQPLKDRVDRKKQKKLDYQDTGAAYQPPKFHYDAFQEHIVEGEILHQRYVSQHTSSAWQNSPFQWVKGRAENPAPPSKLDKLKPIL